MKIYFASDHAGLELKKGLIGFVQNLGFEVEDLGPEFYDENDDYPDTVSKAAEIISKQPHDRAIVIGGSGQGEAIVCNRYQYVRAVVYYGGPLDILSLSRAHNDANVLSLGARFVDPETIGEMVRQWLLAPFSDESRHIRRIRKIDELQKQQ